MSLFEKIMNALIPEQQSDLDIVLKRINNKRNIIRNVSFCLINSLNKEDDVDTILNKSKSFDVGYFSQSSFLSPYSHKVTFNHFKVQFNDNLTSCVVKVPNDNVPLFVFDDQDDVDMIRHTLISKYKQQLTDKRSESYKDFVDM